MRNAAYWRERALLLEEAAHKQGADYLETIEREFRKASQGIQDDIARWYARFASNNGITLAEAKRWLTTAQLEEFRWSVQDYSKAGESLDPKFRKQLENASARVHISRLESLQFQLQAQIEYLYGNHVDDLDALLRKIYANGYYHTAFELQRGMGLGWDLQSLQETQLWMVLSRPWSTDSRSFRDRCWTNKTALRGAIQTQLTQAIIRGSSPDQITKAIAARFHVSKNKAGRLAMTESAYFSAQAQKDAFRALDVQQYEIVSTLDAHTCDICGGLDGKVFALSDYEAGVTAHPFHPWCRCCTAPYFADHSGERAARDQNGKGYYLPATTSFTDWKKRFVDNGSNDAIIVKRALSGALNPLSVAAEEHAIRYYEAVRHMKSDVEKIAHHVKMPVETIQKIKDHIFLKEHELLDGRRRFDPSYEMAQSWQRLMEGKDIRAQDLILLKHEYRELALMESGYTQDEAHILASKAHNYAKALEEDSHA